MSMRRKLRKLLLDKPLIQQNLQNEIDLLEEQLETLNKENEQTKDQLAAEKLANAREVKKHFKIIKI